MNSANQIALFAQRRLRGKLHLARGGIDGLNTMPICGRQLNNHRAERRQQSDRVELATCVEEFTYQLLSRKACTHCATRAGLLVRPGYEVEDGEDE